MVAKVNVDGSLDGDNIVGREHGSPVVLVCLHGEGSLDKLAKEVAKPQAVLARVQ